MRSALLLAYVASCQWVSGLRDIELYEPGSSDGGAMGGGAAAGHGGEGAADPVGGGGAGGGAGAAGGGVGGSGGAEQPTVLHQDLDMPTDVVVDDDAIYYVERGLQAGEGRIWQLDKRGGAPQELLANEDFPHELTLAASGLIFAAGVSGANDIVKLELLPTPLRSIHASAQGSVQDIAVDATHVYWSGAGLQRAPLAGGAVEPLASSGIIGIDAGDASDVYYSNGSELRHVPKSGGTPVTIHSGDAPTRLLGDGNRLVFTETFALGGVYVVPKQGGATVTVGSAQFTPRGIALDALSGEVFWTNCASPRAVMRGDIDGVDEATELQQAVGCPIGIAIDADHVYWTDSDDGKLWRTPR
jgi:hypothetical protein